MGPKVPSQGNNMHNIFTDTTLVLLFWFAPYLYGYPIARLGLENVLSNKIFIPISYLSHWAIYPI